VEDVKGAKFFAGKANNGWIAEVAIPWKQFAGFAPKPGVKLALEMILNDTDSTHERFSLISAGDVGKVPKNPTLWSYLLLEK